MDSYFIGRVVKEEYKRHDSVGTIEITACEEGIDDPSARLIFLDLQMYGRVGIGGRQFTLSEAIKSSMTDAEVKRAILDDKAYKVVCLAFTDRDDTIIITLERQ